MIAGLSSCGPVTEFQKADALAEQYDKIGRSSEKCSFAPKVADAYARAGDGEKVQFWQQKEKISCLNTRTSQSVGDYSD